jgi:iron complex transport system permease protein
MQVSSQRALTVLSILATAALASLLLAAATGSVALPLASLPHALAAWFNGDTGNLPATLLGLRLARAGAAFVTGASLALAGVMMQALLRNPLADPYILGISGGAAVGALGSMLFFAGVWSADAGAFTGAIAISLLLYLLARGDLRSGLANDGGSSLLLLTGVILSSGCMALVTLMLALAPEQQLRGMVFWTIGDLGGAQSRWLPWLLLAAGSLLALRAARGMNLMSIHGDAAYTLGVPVGRLRQLLFFCCALLTASAVSGAGSIGFVGLIVPHACRFALGSDHRLLLPAATLVGGIFLVLADTLARTVAAPQQLPVGAVTALVGVPVFLVQLHRIRRRRA